jgi:serine/threonine protein kinase/tetratricopeptide (TPR) repeat protein
MPEAFERELAVFSAARRLAGAERAAYLDQTCAGEPVLRQRVEELLRAGEDAAAFLKDPAPGAQRPADAPPALTLGLSTAAAGEKAGDRIGHYKLLQQIGEGGCGLVYMAEQEEPVRRRVALKVIKLGMDTKSVIARFEAERQALAMMDHPNIAKIYDAGATGGPLTQALTPDPSPNRIGGGPPEAERTVSAGRPYFVMELVKGIKITDYCDEHSLSTKERLELFIQVCHAVQHAHQKGIIHRDLKPSNILVASDDGVAVPKVIDFGIAKATQGRLTDQTLFTAFEQFIGTPAYMSPEQAELTMQDVDTRTDIYSLGVLLYELLIGRTPFDTQELLASGLDVMRRTIREREPQRPSTKLSTMLEDELTTTARHRHTESVKLIHSLRGDLDWIVMKCLEKDRARRYETATGLANDVKRHLNCEPVVARPPSRLYEFQKTVRRHKFGFAAGAALILVLALGVLVSTWQAVRATREKQIASRERDRAVRAEGDAEHQKLTAQSGEKKAQTEALKSAHVALFLKDMLRNTDPDVASGRDTTLLREILDRTADRARKDLAQEPEVEAELLNVAGHAYETISEHAKAEAAFRRALELQRKFLAKDDPVLADTLFGLADAVAGVGQNPVEAEAFFRESLEIRRKLYGEESGAVADCLNNFSGPLLKLGKVAEAESVLQQSLAIKRKLLPKDDPGVAISLRDLGLLFRSEGKLVDAEGLLEQALAMFRRTLGNVHGQVAFTLQGLMNLWNMQGKLPEAEAAGREALAIQRKLYDVNAPPLRWTLEGLSDVLQKQGKLADAEALTREVVEARRKIPNSETNREFGLLLYDLAGLLRDEGKLTEAETTFREVLGMARKVLGDDNRDVVTVVDALVNVLLLQRKYDEAEKVFDDIMKTPRTDHPDNVGLLRLRGKLRARLMRFADAEVDFTRVIELTPDDFDVWHWEATVLAQLGRLDARRQLCDRALGQFANTANLFAADHIARACLMLPGSGPDLETASKLAELAASAPTNHSAIKWFWMVKGLAEYRQRHYENSLRWMEKVLTAKGAELSRDASAWIVIAMAQHGLNQGDKAQVALGKGRGLVETKMAALDKGDLGEQWLDWITARALLAEAVALIGGQPAPATE